MGAPTGISHEASVPRPTAVAHALVTTTGLSDDLALIHRRRLGGGSEASDSSESEKYKRSPYPDGDEAPKMGGASGFSLEVPAEPPYNGVALGLSPGEGAVASSAASTSSAQDRHEVELASMDDADLDLGRSGTVGSCLEWGRGGGAPRSGDRWRGKGGRRDQSSRRCGLWTAGPGTFCFHSFY